MKGLIFLILLIVFCEFLVNGGEMKGFTVDLIHPNSPSSPFYNMSTTPTKFQSINFPENGKYVVRYNIGSPPLEQFAIVDTGSSLVWLQCHPCNNCYPQTSANFYPFHSSTYKNILCTSDSCKVTSPTNCGGLTKDQCLYQYPYADGSFSNGVLATDTLTFNSDTSQVQLPNIIVGCGYNNNIRATHVPSGVIGLARGASSLNSQLVNIMPNRFSYCLVPPEISGSNSKLSFGEDADIISGSSFVSTPLLSHGDGEAYYLRLEGVTIGNNRINNDDPTLGGNMLIDSGSYYSVLKQRLYADLEAEVRRRINLNPVAVQSGGSRLCYQTEPLRRIVGEMRMVFHFSGGADVTLDKTNIFLEDNSGGLTCFAMLPSPDNNSATFGARAQINFLIQYDVANNIISFAPRDCTNSN